MNFDLYFTVNERDLQDIDDYLFDWAYGEDVDCKVDPHTDYSQIRLEDGVTALDLASLEPCPLRTRLERSLMKPLPPIPEEAKSNSRSASGSHEAPARSETRPGLRLTPSPCHSAKNEIAYKASLQRRPRVTRVRQEGSDNCRPYTTHGVVSGRPCASQASRDLSMSPLNPPSEKQTASKVLDCSQSLQTDKTSNADYDSMHSPETSDLDRWASEMYGAHESTMTALREKRCRRPISNTNVDPERSSEPVPIINKRHVTTSKLERFYGCSDMSVSSFNDCASSYNETTPLVDHSGRPLSHATQAASFFDFNDDDDDDAKYQKSRNASHGSAKGVWRKMALSLRTARGKLPASQARSSNLPPIDVPMILT